MSWLDPFTIPIVKNGITLPARHKLVLGAGLAGTDDPINDATILTAGASAVFVEAQVRYFDKAGSSLGTGSRGEPFATAQQALASITDASSTKPYIVAGGVGTFVEPYFMKPWTYLVGRSRLATIMSPPPGNILDPTFSLAGAQETGIAQCTFTGSPVTVDFAAVGSLGAGKFRLVDCDLDGVALAVTGNNNTNLFVAKNVQQIASTAGLTHAFTNINFHVSMNIRNNAVAVTNNAAYTIAPIFRDMAFNGTVTATCTSQTNILSVSAIGCTNNNSNLFTLTGDGVIWTGPSMSMSLNTPDSDMFVEFATVTNTGAIRGLNGGRNTWQVGITANRTFGSTNPSQGTQLRMKRTENGPFLVFFTSGQFASGSTISQSYLGQGAMWDATFVSSWLTQNSLQQRGTIVTLAAGVSPLILADVVAGTSDSTLIPIRTDLNGSTAIGHLTVLDADRAAGSRVSGTAGFIVKSLKPDGTVETNDNSKFRWIANQLGN